jgi:hypothetical protein
MFIDGSLTASRIALLLYALLIYALKSKLFNAGLPVEKHGVSAGARRVTARCPYGRCLLISAEISMVQV